MSLRTRLVLVLSGLLALGMALSVGATFGALQDWRNDQSDDVLAAVAGQLREDLTGEAGGEQGGEQGGERVTLPGERNPRPGEGSSPTGAGDLPAGAGDLPAGERDRLPGVWRAAASKGDIPSFFEIRSYDGRVLRSADFGARPDLPTTLPAALRPNALDREGTSDDVSGGIFHRLTSADGRHWLLHSSRLPDGILLVAMETARADELTRRTAVVAATSAGVALLAVTLLSWRAVRRGLRPLEEMAATASAIGGGDLTRRVPAAGPRTEVGRLGAALNAMLGQIESAFTERTRSEDRLRRFVADASHELRTPVATIRGYAELFRRGAASRPDDLARAMARIESEARRMGTLVEELLLLATLDQGVPVARDPVDVRALAAEAVDDARVLAPGRPLLFEAAGRGPVLVRGDADRLRQVLANLLANVRHHTPDGTEAWVRVAARDGWAVTEVTDHGPGLTEEQARHVFERFFRADPSRTRAHLPAGGRDEGSGLGLAIVAAVVGAHGGRVEAERLLGPGASGVTFRISLPLADGPGDGTGGRGSGSGQSPVRAPRRAS
ncbi:sensor histidine kinase [Streptomyces sp. NPDC059452]|uniref:sensor histidine kinase n=1 Tax=Streptomyces sp. NPDC059452 TaxID=3346835 RepID=UPI0036910862